MGTPLEKVYSAFLSKMLEDEWLNWTQEEVEEDLLTILDGASLLNMTTNTFLKNWIMKKSKLLPAI